jgi:predicted nucleotidyltransferase
MRSKNSILELLKEHISIFDPFKHVYLFGSVIDPNIAHNDIDILIIYVKYSDEIENTLQVISNELEKASGLPIDLTALSIEEERDIAFLERIKPHYIKIK